MLIMASDHHDKLLMESANNQAIAQMYQVFLPVFKDFQLVYHQTFAVDAVYQGNTQMVEALFMDLSSQKIKQWDIWIQNVFLDDTPQYKMLLPNYRSDFQRGGYDARINSIKMLQTNLGLYPQLANVLADVSSFLQQIESARIQQQGYEKQVSNLVKDVEDKRVLLAQVMHGIFGGLLQVYYLEPWRVETFYELKYLRSPAPKGSVLKSFTVNANARLSLFDGQLTDSETITMKNTGSSVLVVFSSNSPNSPVPAAPLYLQPGETIAFFADEHTDGLGFNWLNVVNDNPNTLTFDIGKE
jgi:hypothetical protein